jgi:hypothetical protein
MMESMTQLMFKGYEEARVALTALLFSVPCCVLAGVEYGVFQRGELVKARICGWRLGGRRLPGLWLWRLKGV